MFIKKIKNKLEESAKLFEALRLSTIELERLVEEYPNKKRTTIQRTHDSIDEVEKSQYKIKLKEGK